jgi:hypothetical protein
MVHGCFGVLPNYTPALPQANPAMEKDDLIRHYFQQGYSNNEIAVFLALHHGIVSCVRTIKRILKRLNLKRASKRNHSSVESIIRAILRELDSSSGSFLGYRQLTQRLRRKYNLNVTRDIVMTYIRVIDPVGVDQRRSRRLRRRKYTNPGPNFLWHIDGWDKLAPFGFYIHGAIDGYSRRIIWLEVGSTNKNPRFIAWHYLDTVQQLGGVPRLVRSDKGTENVVVRDLQQLFRWDNEDNLAGSKSFIQGKSSSNQRIESWWSKLRNGGGGWWMIFFKDLRDSGINIDDPVLSECLKFLFMPILRKELFLVAELWNTHTIQSQPRHELNSGKPDVLFFMPEIDNKRNYLIHVNTEDITICREMYTENCPDYDPNVEELIRLLIPNFIPPADVNDALKLFSDIVQLVNDC